MGDVFDPTQGRLGPNPSPNSGELASDDDDVPPDVTHGQALPSTLMPKRDVYGSRPTAGGRRARKRGPHAVWTRSALRGSTVSYAAWHQDSARQARRGHEG